MESESFSQLLICCAICKFNKNGFCEFFERSILDQTDWCYKYEPNGEDN